MLASFGNKATIKIWQGERDKGYPNAIQDIARRKLRMLNNAHNLTDMLIPPSNRLENLKGNWKE